MSYMKYNASYYSLTISWATTSGTSLSRSNVNSMAPLSLYFPFNFLWSSTHSLRAIDAFFPSSSSASSTLTPVSSAKKAWFSRSLMVYLGEGTMKLRLKSVLYTLLPLNCNVVVVYLDISILSCCKRILVILDERALWPNLTQYLCCWEKVAHWTQTYFSRKSNWKVVMDYFPLCTQNHYVTEMKDTLQMWKETAVLLWAQLSAPQQ